MTSSWSGPVRPGWPRPSTAQFSDEHRPEFQYPSPHRFVGHIEPTLSEQIFDLYAARISADGSADEAWMKGAIDFTQKSLGGDAREVPPARVFDFSFAQKAAR